MQCNFGANRQEAESIFYMSGTLCHVQYATKTGMTYCIRSHFAVCKPASFCWLLRPAVAKGSQFKFTRCYDKIAQPNVTPQLQYVLKKLKDTIAI